MKRLHGDLAFPWLLSLCLLSSVSLSQDVVTSEEAQEVLSALATADMVQESGESWQNKKVEQQDGESWRGHWDSRIEVSGPGEMDSLTRFKLNSSFFSARGRWRRNENGSSMQAFTANMGVGNLSVQMGGVGMSAGYGLLISSPGRAGGLAAGQALSSPSTKIKGWATTAEKRSVTGGGLSWRGKGWTVVGLHGRLGESDECESLSAVNLGKQLGNVKIGMGLMGTNAQRGISLNGKWQDGPRQLGFEWVSWGKNALKSQQSVWLVSLKTNLLMGFGMEAQWGASSSSTGPLVGVRPSVLGAWGGAGWAIRVSSPGVKSWRLKFLFAESRGVDWDGDHQSLGKQFADVIIRGRPRPGWEFSARWHHRVRTWEAWSDSYPWLPPALVKEDERSGLTLDLKFGKQERSWICSVRNLGRKGATTDGTRTLASVRHRRSLGKGVSILVSFQSAWGEAVDLVTAINPIRGVLLPRHWGHWSSEIMTGLDFPFFGTKLMAAISKRTPALGEDRPSETAFWAGARADW